MVSYLAAIRSRFPQATLDDFVIRDKGQGPWVDRWNVQQDGQSVPPPSMAEIESWRQEIKDAGFSVAGLLEPDSGPQLGQLVAYKRLGHNFDLQANVTAALPFANDVHGLMGYPFVIPEDSFYEIGLHLLAIKGSTSLVTLEAEITSLSGKTRRERVARQFAYTYLPIQPRAYLKLAAGDRVRVLASYPSVQYPKTLSGPDSFLIVRQA